MCSKVCNATKALLDGFIKCMKNTVNKNGKNRITPKIFD